MISRRIARVLPLALPLAGLTVLGLACSSSPPSATPSTSAPAAGAAGCTAGAVLDEPLLAPATGDQAQAASYANDPTAPQAKDCDGMRRFIATPQPGFDLQSYVFYGHLKDSTGTEIAFSTLAQRSNVAANASPTAPKSSLQIEGMTINSGEGTTFGGVEGAPEQTDAVSLTSNPWSERSQSFSPGQAPQYLDARVVEGQLGQPGAVIELTGQVQGIAAGGSPTPMQIAVRAKDVAGVGQWGYGPSGFFPQWIYPNQREAITNQHGGSVQAYLEASNDPMTNQGSYYYSSPVLEVETFSISRHGQVVNSGTEGELLADYVTQSFDQKADQVVDEGVQWTEFSTLLDGDRTMKIGQVTQSSVGTLPYAVLLAADGSRGANGSLQASQRWNLGAIHITPEPGAVWTSPRSNKTYSTTYTVALDDPDATKSAKLTFTAVYPDQELSLGGRTVYEGLYAVKGTLGGQPATGFAWAEIQPAGAL